MAKVEWEDLWQSAHARAFSVASKVPAEALRRVQGRIDLLVSTGASFREAKTALQPEAERLAGGGQ